MEMVPIKTRVRIVNYPTKIGRKLGALYLEVHDPRKEKGRYVHSDTTQVMKVLKEVVIREQTAINWHLAKQIVVQQKGIPTLLN